MKMNTWVGIVLALLIGWLIGLWQGYWIAYARIPAFIVTLAGMLMFRGLTGNMLKGPVRPVPRSLPEDQLGLRAAISWASRARLGQ